MPAWVMALHQRRIGAQGFGTVQFGYRSVRASLQDNAARLAACVRDHGPAPVHLVGHSLGGVLALFATARHGLAQVRRIVLVGSPYAGSHAARALGRWRLGRRMLGRTLPEWLDADKPSCPPGVELGVIAGNRRCGLGVLVDPQLPTPNDGVVSVAETVVPGMQEHRVLPVTHATMLCSASVSRRIVCFLRSGRFESEVSGAPGKIDQSRGETKPR